MGAGVHGGFGNTQGSPKEDNQANPKQHLPKDESQLKHIFRDKPGHLKDTPQNRKLLVKLANNKNKYVGKDKYGNS